MVEDGYFSMVGFDVFDICAIVSFFDDMFFEEVNVFGLTSGFEVFDDF